jgi:hypothetical protein
MSCYAQLSATNGPPVAEVYILLEVTALHNVFMPCRCAWKMDFRVFGVFGIFGLFFLLQGSSGFSYFKARRMGF